jgi:hypothetical protein
MNANELANFLETDCWYKLITRQDIATMLRQQQTEIEALKLQLHTTLTNRDLRTYDGKTEINNEPVAWMCPTGLEYKQRATDFMYNDALYDTKLNWIPLYTHPVKELTPLTEDECRAIIEKHNWFAKSWAEMAMEIQDAILRKAQEK